MVPPVRTEKRVERRVVDGVEQEVEVSCPSRGCSSSLARKFVRAFLVTARSFPPTFSHCIEPIIRIASHLLSHPIPSPPRTFFLSRYPSYPTDIVASNDGTPGPHELLTTRHDLIYTLYYLLHAHRWPSSPHSFVIARIRSRPRLMSAATSVPRHLSS